MKACLTKPIMQEFSGCLVENPSCRFAVRFGFSYICEHPNHKDFLTRNNESTHQLDHNKLYKELKEARRSEYISKVKRYIEEL